MEAPGQSRFQYKPIVTISFILTFGFCQIAGEVSTSIEVTPSGYGEGTNVYISCTAINFNSNQVLSWSKNGQRITRDTTILLDDLKERVIEGDLFFHFDSDVVTVSAFSHLNFASITKHDTGTYSCEVYEETNGDDILLTSDEVNISVLYVPSLEYPACTPNTEVFINIDQPLVLSCLSEEGNPRVNLTWKRDFVNDEDQDKESVSAYGAGFVTSELVIPRVSLKEQNAVFSCHIANHIGSKSRSCSIRTQVILPEPLITISPQIATVYFEENSIQFTCSSYLAMSNLYWSKEPKDVLSDRDIQLSSNRQILTINDITTRDNASSISCTFKFKDDWIKATAVLYVTNKTGNVTDGTTSSPDDSKIGSSGSSVGSALGWMIAFIAATLIAIVCCIAYFLKVKSKRSADNTRNRTPYVINNIGDTVQGDINATMGTGHYMSYHGQIQSPRDITGENTDGDQHRPEQSITQSGQESGDHHSRRSENIENPEYMRTGDYIGGTPNTRPIQIRNMSHVSQATTVEPDYMPLNA